jgi:hypothetical protein
MNGENFIGQKVHGEPNYLFEMFSEKSFLSVRLQFE